MSEAIDREEQSTELVTLPSKETATTVFSTTDAVERQKQAIARAEAEKLAAEQRAKDAAEAARQAEIKRQEQEQERIAEEQRKREADREHKGKVMGEAKDVLMAAGITEEQARNVVRLITAGKVPNVRIHF